MSIQYAILLLYLGFETDTDIKRREISVMNWIIAWGVLFGISVWLSGFEKTIGGMAPGILIMALSKATGGGIGYGDGMILILCGMVLGLERVCVMFFIALFLLFPFSLWMIAVKKEDGKKEIAFLPFLLAAYLILLFTIY